MPASDVVCEVREDVLIIWKRPRERVGSLGLAGLGKDVEVEMLV